MVSIEATAIPDVKVVTPKRHGDHRGFFSETFNLRDFAEGGIAGGFVQDNHSLSGPVGTVRGLHFQSAPFAQDKLVRVVRGAILDVAVDLRRSSPTYGRHVAVELSAQNWRQLWVPVGFAHGFCTLEPDTEVVYKVTGYYSAAHDHGMRWNDPDLGIAWPVAGDAALLSAKDAAQPRFAELPAYFD
ncbi:dTDP-4-dehydrorhamnose 3,5-epimerase [Chelatococcus reniformis]|uniref:dTDP-4-dehydrorhamnose 3,5-epimerase n=1 Tax=Chelatococcus reniformis TaxID=1494448 RepID=A0A916U146_9HYPH|nr:dTDP-4-dehydrorhamnose 3,5-epimerase [Chelatococcus reniformis]GGC53961.1 dTDP-4-dehydrorhamnose 3,5-epimerase [Chelatococcus reniformis]